jgi:hypothetical protein
MTHYVAILAPWEAGTWRVLIPDAPECEAIGSSADGAMLAAAMKVMRRVRTHNIDQTAPRDLLAIATDREWMSRNDIDFAKAVVTLIPSGAP